jgi:asparagine synthase (glutamine-hydrolysing)
MHRVAHRLGTIESVDDLHRSLTSLWPRPSELMTVRPASADLRCLLDDPLPACLDADPASRMMTQDMRTYLPDDILCKVDRAAMGVSLETRTPFLDPQALTLSARLPVKIKIRDGKGKWALRQALYRHVPRELIERPKTGFAVPVGEWMRGPLKPWAEALLSDKSLAADGLLNPAPVRRVWEEHLSGRRDWTQQLWIVLMFMAWRAAER